jgi:hypothetical protein
LLQKEEFEIFCKWVGVSDEKYGLTKERARLLKSRGFCNYHFWQLSQISSKAGIAVVCDGLIEKIINILRKEKGSRRLPALVKYRCGRHCPICDDLKKAENYIYKKFIALLDSHKSQYEKKYGLCVPHLIKIAAHVKGRTLIPFLLDTKIKQLERLKLNASNFIDKKKKMLRGEISHDEEASWFFAVEKLTGSQGTLNE